MPLAWSKYQSGRRVCPAEPASGTPPTRSGHSSWTSACTAERSACDISTPRGASASGLPSRITMPHPVAAQEDLRRCRHSRGDRPSGRCPEQSPCRSVMKGGGSGHERNQHRGDNHDGAIEAREHAGQPPALLVREPLPHTVSTGPGRSPQALVASRQPDDDDSKRRSSHEHPEKDPERISIPVLPRVGAHWLRVAHQEVKAINEQHEYPERDGGYACKDPCALAHGPQQLQLGRLALCGVRPDDLPRV